MKRMLTLLLAALLLCPLPVLCEEAPRMVPEMTALRTANQALMDRYGLTLPALGLFDSHVDLCGETAIVTYTGNAIPSALTGTYYVIIAPHGVQVLWTCDGSLVPWQDGELDSPVWGMPQLQKYLATSSMERHEIFSPYFPEELDTLAAFEEAGGSYHDVTSANAGAADSAKVLARRAVISMYDLTQEQANALATYGGDTRLVRYPDRHGEWEVMLHLEDGTEEVSFWVVIHAETGLILNVVVSSGGVG